MRKWMAFGGMFVLTIVTVTGIAVAQDDRATIKKVMKVAFKGALGKTVIAGRATSAQKEELLGLFKDLTKVKPPRGDETSWKKKTDALVDASQQAVDGKPTASASLKKATNCKSCHDAHKGQ